MDIAQQLLICECSSSEHQMIMRYFEDDKDPFVYVDIYLSKKSLWKRIKHAVRYIFGYQCAFGAFEEVVLGADHIKTLEKVVEHMKRVEAKRLTANSD